MNSAAFTPAAPPVQMAGVPTIAPTGAPIQSGSVPWVQPVMRWKKQLILDRYGPPLPTDRCIKCNCATDQRIRKTFSPASGAVLILALFIPLLFFVCLISHFLQERASVEFGICKRCQNRRMLGMSLGITALLLTIPLFVGAVMGSNSGWWFLGGVVSLIAGIFITVLSLRIALAKRVDKRWIHLRGGGKAFNASIPESPIPQF